MHSFQLGGNNITIAKEEKLCIKTKVHVSCLCTHYEEPKKGHHFNYFLLFVGHLSSSC